VTLSKASSQILEIVSLGSIFCQCIYDFIPV
jgi:hypothetical protein